MGRWLGCDDGLGDLISAGYDVGPLVLVAIGAELLLHCTAPAPENFPTAQMSHTVVPALAAYLPEVQLMQLANGLVEVLPAVQIEHWDSPLAANWPEVQLTQLDCPVSPWYCPVGQMRHID